MLTEKMNAIFPLYHSIFFQPFPVFSLNVHITTELNGTIMITFSMHSVVSFCSPFGFSLLLSFLAMFSTCMHMSLLQQVKDGRAP